MPTLAFKNECDEVHRQFVQLAFAAATDRVKTVGPLIFFNRFD